MFNKNNLENGDYIVSGGQVYQYLENFKAFVNEDGWLKFDGYNSDLTHNSVNSFDIMKVYRPQQPYQCRFNRYTDGELVFDRANFTPHLEMRISGSHRGNIGEETEVEGWFGEKLYIGDVVELYNICDRENVGKRLICKSPDYPKGFVMGVAGTKFKNGNSGNWQIRKVKSYKDLSHDENIDGIIVKLK